MTPHIKLLTPEHQMPQKRGHTSLPETEDPHANNTEVLFGNVKLQDNSFHSPPAPPPDRKINTGVLFCIRRQVSSPATVVTLYFLRAVACNVPPLAAVVAGTALMRHMATCRVCCAVTCNMPDYPAVITRHPLPLPSHSAVTHPALLCILCTTPRHLLPIGLNCPPQTENSPKKIYLSLLV